MTKKRTTKLKDVAEKANVSLAAASRILRGDDSEFGVDTCRRVTEVAEQLGYRRNLLVQGMQKGSTKMVGVMIPPFDSGWSNVLNGIHMTLSEADYLPVTVWIGDYRKIPSCDHEEQEAARQIDRLLDRRVEGLIMWPSYRLAYYDQFRELVEQKVPVTVIEPEHSAGHIPHAVETDERQLAADVASHLLELGHRRIACLSGREEAWQSWAFNRRHNFEKVIQECVDAECKSWRLNLRGDDGPEVAHRLLDDPLNPTAVFAVTDHEALHVYRAAAERGLKIPDDLSVIGCADLDFAQSLIPPLTTMRQQHVEIGRRAALLLLEQIEHERANNEHEPIQIPAELVVRDSTGPPPADHP